MAIRKVVLIHTLYGILPLALLVTATTFNTLTVKFSLPEPTSARVLCFLVPVLIYTTSLLAHYNHTWHTKSRLWLCSVALHHYLLLVLSLILLNISLNSIMSPAIQSYTLQVRWLKLFQTKNGRAIRGIQDAMDCCGFKSSHDMAWPFEDKDHGARACELEFGRTRGCETGWARKERTVMVAMAVIGGIGVAYDVVVNLSILWGLRTGTTEQQSVPDRSYETYTDEPGSRREGTEELDGDRTQIVETYADGAVART